MYAAKRTEFGWSKFGKPIHIKNVCSIKNLFIDFSLEEKDKKEHLEKFFDKAVEHDYQKIIDAIKGIPVLVDNSSVFEREEIFLP